MSDSSVDFHEDAEREMLYAADFYDSKEPGLADRFLDEIDCCLETIVENPLSWPVIHGAVRKRVLNRFPYSILYRIDKHRVYILAVMHQRRKPGYWRKRIG